MERQLQTCPFCGGEASVVWNPSDNSQIVACGSCYARTPKAYVRSRNFVKKEVGGRNFKNDEYAEAWIVQLWNTRTQTDKKESQGYRLAEGEVI